MRAVVPAVVSVISLFACTNPTEPVLANVSVRLTRQTMGSSGELDLRLSVRIENATSETVDVNVCSATLERQEAIRRWESTGGILCIAIGFENPLDGMIPVPASEFREIPMSIRVQGEASAHDDNYRLRLSIATPMPRRQRLRTGGDPLIQSLTTNEFTWAPS